MAVCSAYIIFIVIFLLLVFIGVIMYLWSGAKHKQSAARDSILQSPSSFEAVPTTATPSSIAHGALVPARKTRLQVIREAGKRASGGLWEDQVIVAARVPRGPVIMVGLLHRSSQSEVYTGLYEDRRVAIKALAPEARTQLWHIHALLAEAKLLAPLAHPRIVEFVGVAWDSLSDLCLLTEFMDGGDLRSHFKLQAQRAELGFGSADAQIALHVAQALAYLHSVSVVHRNLTSRSILLNSDRNQAKLSGLGVLNETPSQMMTARANNASLWTAPEVIVGEQYDHKADMFSFGVVLSELATRALPYAQSRSNGSRVSSAADSSVLQLVSMGRLRVQFAPSTPALIKELGLACVALDPRDRPTAAEALQRLEQLSGEQSD